MPGLVPPVIDERACLLAFLAQQRDGIRYAAHGLTDEQAMARPSVSELSLGGLVKHAALVEQAWIGPSCRTGTRPIFLPEYDWTDGFRLVHGETLADVVSLLGRRGGAHREDRDATCPTSAPRCRRRTAGVPWIPAGLVWSPRWVLLHLIEETARHAGHADIVRESLDGATLLDADGGGRGVAEHSRPGNSARLAESPGAVLNTVCRSMCGPTYACPWCALGVYRLDVARAAVRARRRDHACRTAPSSWTRVPRPGAPQTMDEMLAVKYGMSPEQITGRPRAPDRVGRRGRHGVPLRPDPAGQHLRRPPPGPGGPGHGQPRTALVKGLFARLLHRGRAALGPRRPAAAWPRRPAWTTMLAAERAGRATPTTTDVRADEAVAQELGITGVPHFRDQRQVGHSRGPGRRDAGAGARPGLGAHRRRWSRRESRRPKVARHATGQHVRARRHVPRRAGGRSR